MNMVDWPRRLLHYRGIKRQSLLLFLSMGEGKAKHIYLLRYRHVAEAHPYYKHLML